MRFHGFRFRRNNSIVMNVEYAGETIWLHLPYTWLIQARKIVKIYQMIHAELVARRTFFTATNVVCRVNFLQSQTKVCLDIQIMFTKSCHVLHKLGCCYSNLIKGAHHCVERAMHHNCPVCFEVIRLLGVTLHAWAIQGWTYSCPSCNKFFSYCILSLCFKYWSWILKGLAFCIMVVVFIWLNEEHYCITMWTYDTSGVCQGNGASP